MKRRQPEWAVGVVADGVEWAETGPHPGEQHWLRKAALPIENERVFVRLQGPALSARAGERMKLLFRPALSAINGWFEHPQEIGLSGLVDVQVVREGDDRWAEVLVERARSLHAHADELPLTQKGALPDLRDHHTVHTVEHDEWIFVDASTEGDLGAWILARRTSPATAELLLQAEWLMSEGVIYAGRRRIDPAWLLHARSRS